METLERIIGKGINSEINQRRSCGSENCDFQSSTLHGFIQSSMNENFLSEQFWKSNVQGLLLARLPDESISSFILQVYSVIVREFLCVHEYGTVIFHRRYSKPSQDIVLRSGLISALYNFAQEVEGDAIDVIRMEKVSLLFKKRDLLIFVLFFDSTVNPGWCKREINVLANRFFRAFPEVLWNAEIVNLTMFMTFKAEADHILENLNRKLELILYLIEEGLVTEEEFQEQNFQVLGQIVGTRLMGKSHNQFAYVLEQGKEFVFSQVDLLLDLLNASHIERIGSKYRLDCSRCFLCEDQQDCFFTGVLGKFLVRLNLDPKISFLPKDEVS